MHRVLFASGLAALVGALLWGAITYYTGYEIGYVAWGIGLLVGGAAVAVGGHGKNCGILCAGLALAAIFAGKMMAVQFTVPGEVRKMMEKVLTPQAYEDNKKDASDFAALTSKEQYAEFMVAHGYCEAKKAADVSSDDLADFTQNSAPMLENFQREQPSYGKWKDEKLAQATSIVSAGPVFESVVENLNGIDILFAFFGLATAYRIPARRGESAT